jgi:hypothetical protein
LRGDRGEGEEMAQENKGLICFLCPEYKSRQDNGIKIIEMFLLEKCLFCRKVNPEKMLDRMVRSGILIANLNDLHRLAEQKRGLN